MDIIRLESYYKDKDITNFFYYLKNQTLNLKEFDIIKRHYLRSFKINLLYYYIKIGIDYTCRYIQENTILSIYFNSFDRVSLNYDDENIYYLAGYNYGEFYTNFCDQIHKSLEIDLNKIRKSFISIYNLFSL